MNIGDTEPKEEILLSDYDETDDPHGEQYARWFFDSRRINTKQKEMVDRGCIICGLDVVDLGKTIGGSYISKIIIKYITTKHKG